MLYLYQGKGMSSEKWEALQASARACGKDITLWDDSQLDTVIGELLDQASSLKPRLGDVYKEKEDHLFLLMDVDKEELDEVLASLREHDCHLPLKAVVTENNRTWTLAHLLEDVAEEAKMIQKIMQIRQILAASQDFRQEDYRKDAWEAFVDKREEAQELMHQVGKVELSLDDLQTCFIRFNDAALTLIHQGKV